MICYIIKVISSHRISTINAYFDGDECQVKKMWINYNDIVSNKLKDSKHLFDIINVCVRYKVLLAICDPTHLAKIIRSIIINHNSAVNLSAATLTNM